MTLELAIILLGALAFFVLSVVALRRTRPTPTRREVDPSLYTDAHRDARRRELARMQPYRPTPRPSSDEPPPQAWRFDHHPPKKGKPS